MHEGKRGGPVYRLNRRRRLHRVLDAIAKPELTDRAGATQRQLSQVLNLEVLSKFARIAPRDHEHTITAVMNRPRVPGCGRGMCLDDLENEEAVFLDEARVDEFAFEVCIALADERRLDLLAWHGGECKLVELVDVAARGIADADNLRRKIFGRYMADAMASTMMSASVAMRDKTTANELRLSPGTAERLIERAVDT